VLAHKRLFSRDFSRFQLDRTARIEAIYLGRQYAELETVRVVLFRGRAGPGVFDRGREAGERVSGLLFLQMGGSMLAGALFVLRQKIRKLLGLSKPEENQPEEHSSEEAQTGPQA
jgi:hypothetical protein